MGLFDLSSTCWKYLPMELTTLGSKADALAGFYYSLSLLERSYYLELVFLICWGLGGMGVCPALLRVDLGNTL